MGETEERQAFAAFAPTAGFQLQDAAQLPGLTPLLHDGDRRHTDSMARGTLANGLDAELAHYTFTEVVDDGPDRHYSFTVVLTSVPESIAFVPRLSLQPHGVSGLGGFGSSLEDHVDSMRSHRSVELESPEMRDRFRLHVDSEVGDNWVRQLFSPAFITWLTHEAPRGTGFELSDGALCIYAEGRLQTPEELTAFTAAASEIAQRIREEAIEEEGHGTAGAAALPDRPGDSLAAKIQRGVDEVQWTTPPQDTKTAVRAYRRTSMKVVAPWIYLIALSLGGIAFGGAIVAGGEFDGLGILLGGPAAGAAIFGKLTGDRAKAFGKAAFAAEYARSRDLVLDNPRLFQARHMRLELPGTVEFALAGPIRGSSSIGTVLMTARKEGKTRTDYNAVAVDLPEGVELGEVPGLQSESHGRTVVLFEETPSDTARTAADLDELQERVAAALTASAPRPAAG